jgi:hypothetical protein
MLRAMENCRKNSILGSVFCWDMFGPFICSLRLRTYGGDPSTSDTAQACEGADKAQVVDGLGDAFALLSTFKENYTISIFEDDHNVRV